MARAVCIVGADQRAEVYINGAMVAFRSDTATPNVVRVETLLRAGENAIAVRAEQTRAEQPSGLVGALRVEFQSGEPLTVQTGSAWQAAADAATDWEKSASPAGNWSAAVELGPTA